VTVQAQPVGGGAPVRTMTTNSSGVYRTIGMAPGSYRVVVVMGDSSRITTTGLTELFVGNADSTVAPTLTYDPGRIISGTLTWNYQDTVRNVSIAVRSNSVRLFKCLAATAAACIGAVIEGATYTQIDAISTSATGAFRFALRPTTVGVFYLKVDTAGVRSQVDSSFATHIPSAALLDTFRLTGVTALSSSGATVTSGTPSSAALPFAYRAPYQIRARIFKDRNGDGAYSSLDTLVGSPTVVSGVRVWLRKAGGTINLGPGTFASGTSTGATGNLTICVGGVSSTTGIVSCSTASPTGLHSNAADGWALHVLTWYLPAGCTLVNSNDMTATGDVVGGTVPTLNIPLSCS
jgi:hypothetical protein